MLISIATITILIAIVTLLIIHETTANNYAQWSFQQRLFVPEAGIDYGKSPATLFGRGFRTLISGYTEEGNALYVHTTDEGYAYQGREIWTLQAKLVPNDGVVGDLFGKSVVSSDKTLIVSSPQHNRARGAIYVFNGTGRYWSQQQKIVAFDSFVNDLFGDSMALHNDRLVVSAKTLSTLGSAYVFERSSGGIFWSLQARLQPMDPGINQFFASKVRLHGDFVIASSRNDENAGDQTGSVYIFQVTNGIWSQQQKLFSEDFQNWNQGDFLNLFDPKIGFRELGPNIAMNEEYIAVGITNLETDKNSRESVYMFQANTLATNRWSLQQRLFSNNESDEYITYSMDVLMKDNTLIATTTGPNQVSSYVFKSFGDGWSLQQRLMASNETTDSGPDVTSVRNFTSPAVWGGTILHRGESEKLIHSQFKNGSCLLIWMSDHFLDGWDTAVLTVRAPDTSNDTFHPHCDQPDPFYVRYCPYQPEDEGHYIIKVFAPTKARFFWEISWRVMEESTGKWYHGDFASEMTFYFDSTDLTFTLSSSENLITFTEPCYGCATIALRNWEQLQVIGNSAFWPLVAAGAPYYISDIEGRKVVSAGKVCDDVIVYECYQRLIDGVYILRLGGGLFGRLTGYPYPTANWTGCGVQGTDRDQLIFRISGGNCIPLQVHRYSGRCDKPQPLNFRAFSSTAAPTGGGTLSPTQSTFGKPYVKGQMYAFDTELEGLSDPLDYNAYRDIELEIEDLDEEKSTKFLQY